MSEYTLSNRVHIDFILTALIFSLCSFGIIILYSASGQNIDLVYSQIAKLFIALLCMILVAQIPPANLNRLSLLLYVLGVILLIFVIIFGDIGKGDPYFGKVEGVMILGIKRNSRAWRSGLRTNDVITSVNKEPIKNLDEFLSAVDQKDKALMSGILFRVIRGNAASFIVVK